MMTTGIAKRYTGRSPAWVIVAASALLSLAACLPARLPALDEIHGVVVDALTGAPIAGAKITVDPRNFGEELVVTTSDRNGEFVVGPKSHFALVPFGSEAYALNLATIHVDVPGYQAADALQDGPDIRGREQRIELRPERR